MKKDSKDAVIVIEQLSTLPESNSESDKASMTESENSTEHVSTSLSEPIIESDQVQQNDDQTHDEQDQQDQKVNELDQQNQKENEQDLKGSTIDSNHKVNKQPRSDPYAGYDERPTKKRRKQKTKKATNDKYNGVLVSYTSEQIPQDIQK
ncbi:hypothetical protein RMATCC62417_17541 [Rhizopus microsporus]|nr:hypothetical protein RMATCC62417_17541 [Rhizopus microsporus]